MHDPHRQGKLITAGMAGLALAVPALTDVGEQL
jgi:hypothetical protein